MKSYKTMRAISEDRAYLLGPRIHNGRAGFFLTCDEVRALYDAHGYNVRGTVVERHVERWFAEYHDGIEGTVPGDFAVWFPAPKEKATAVRIASEQCGGRYVLDTFEMWERRHARLYSEQEALV